MVQAEVGGVVHPEAKSCKSAQVIFLQRLLAIGFGNTPVINTKSIWEKLKRIFSFAYSNHDFFRLFKGSFK